MKQVRRSSIVHAGMVVLVAGVSCGRSTSSDVVERSALAGDPIESVQQVEGVTPSAINNVTSPPDGGSIDNTSFTIGLFEEDAARCPGTNGSIYNCGNMGCTSACELQHDINPAHPSFPPFPAFDDVSTVEVAVNVGSAASMHWDWEYKAYYGPPFFEFWVDVVDQSGQTTRVVNNVSAPAGYGYNGGGRLSRPAFVTGSAVDLDLTSWREQRVVLRFTLHSAYDPSYFTLVGCMGPCNTGGYDVGTSKLYVSNLHVDACKVTSVELLDVASPITDDPKGGKRIFPDKPPPGNGPDRDTVRVVAHTNRPNCPVTLRSFDVDDPSSDATIDPNGPAGNDNLGKANGNKCGDFLPGGACQMNLTSNDDAEAVAGFVVSKQPGDNFVIVAGSDPDEVSKVKMVAGSSDAPVLQDAAGNALTNTHIAVSPKLTVWRHLHVQVDSMGPVVGNHLTGTVTQAAGSTSGTGQALVRVTTRLPANRYAGGRIVFNGKSFTVLGHDDFILILQDQGNPALRSDAGAEFVLYDDDNLAGNSPALMNGDEGFDVPGPDLTMLADSDDPNENVLAPAYIRPTYDLPGDGARPFFLNIEEGVFPFLGQMDSVTQDYWAVYLEGGYQGPVNGCFDPPANNKHQVLGKSRDGQGSIMYEEMIRDYLQTLADNKITTLENGATTTAHEVGHLLGADHGQHGLMGDDDQGVTITKIVFSPESIRAIRSQTQP